MDKPLNMLAPKLHGVASFLKVLVPIIDARNAAQLSASVIEDQFDDVEWHFHRRRDGTPLTVANHAGSNSSRH